MSTNITDSIIKKIKDNETALEEFEKETQSNEAEDTKNIIMNFPTVYIHNWPETGKYDVYVGESNNIFARTRQHYQNKINHKTWQYRMLQKDATLYIIGHEHFNKSLTLYVENRLMHYLMSVDKVRQVHNGRGNPQKNYYPPEEFDTISPKIWTELHESDTELFPDENIVKDSAIYKASPLHKLTDEQEKAKIQILDRIAQARKQNGKQIIFIDGEAGTGKTVLNSSIFYDSSDKFCMKRPLYLPEDGYNSWRRCQYFELDKEISHYDEKKEQYEHVAMWRKRIQEEQIRKKKTEEAKKKVIKGTEKKNVKAELLIRTMLNGYLFYVVETFPKDKKKRIQTEIITITKPGGAKKLITIGRDSREKKIYISSRAYRNDMIEKVYQVLNTK